MPPGAQINCTTSDGFTSTGTWTTVSPYLWSCLP
jgi:hypothetical protein